MQLEDEECLLLLKPLYGVQESCLQWFITFQDHHVKLIGMKPAKVDLCILSERKNYLLIRLTVLQADDTFGHGTE